MILRKFGVRNVRVLRDISVQMEPVTVLVGDNNSGKSSILDAIVNFSGVGRGNFRLPPSGNKYSFEALHSLDADEDFI